MLEYIKTKEKVDLDLLSYEFGISPGESIRMKELIEERKKYLEDHFLKSYNSVCNQLRGYFKSIDYEKRAENIGIKKKKTQCKHS